MSHFKGLSRKERVERIALFTLYPLYALFRLLGTITKYFRTKRRQITAGIVTVCMIITMIPITGQPALVDAVTSTYSVTINGGTNGKLMKNGIAVSGNTATITVTNGQNLAAAMTAQGYTLEPNSGYQLTALEKKVNAKIVKVAAGNDYTILLDSNGNVWTFGANIFGNLGYDTNTVYNSTPKKVPGVSNIKDIAAGYYHTVLLDIYGEVWTFGHNGCGQLGYTTSDSYNSTPQKIPGVAGISAIAAGGYHTVLLDTAGRVLTFGMNTYGELGYSNNINTSNANPFPMFVTTSTQVKAIAAGDNHTVLLDSDGCVWTFGSNEYGQLGDIRNSLIKAPNPTPTTVDSTGDITSIAAGGRQTMLIDNSGVVWSCGSNYYGQLGRSTNNGVPIGIDYFDSILGITNCSAISVGYDHTVALDTNGDVWTFGCNIYGRLGYSSSDINPVPIKLTGISNVTSIAASICHTVLCDTNGNVWTFGLNQYGQLGNSTNLGTTTGNPIPTKVALNLSDTENTSSLSSIVVTCDITVTAQYKKVATLTITASSYTIIYGNNVKLTATLTGANQLSDQTVKFYQNTTLLGTAITDTTGKVSFPVIKPNVGSYSYYAVFDGDLSTTNATSNNESVTIGKGNQASLAFDSYSTTKTYGDSFTVSATGGSGDGDVTYKSSNSAIATVLDSGEVTIVGVGDFTITATKAASTNYTEQTVTTSTITAEKKELTITGLTATDRIYNGTTEVSLTGGLLNGVVNSGEVSATIPTVGTLVDKNAGTNKAVTIPIISLSGSKADCYTLVQPTVSNVTITKATLTVSVNKVTVKVGTSLPPLVVTVTGFVTGEDENLTGFIKPTAVSASYVNTTNTALTNFSVLYSGGNATNNYTFDLSNTTAELEVQSTKITTDDYSLMGSVIDWNKTNLILSPKGDYDLISADKTYWTSSLTLNKEGQYNIVTFYLKNSSTGAFTEGKSISYDLDKTAPTGLKVSYWQNGWNKFSNSSTVDLFFNNTITLKLSATDALSGIKLFKYTLYGIEYTIAATSGEATFTIAPQYKGSISNVFAVDNAGNETPVVSTDTFVIDQAQPTTPSIDTNGYTSGQWTKDSVRIDLTGSTALSGISKYQYSINGGSTWIDMSTVTSTAATTENPFNVTKASITISSETSGTQYIFRAISGSGIEGITSSPVTVKLSKSTPTITDVTGNTTSYTQNDVTLTVTASSDSGIRKYSFDDGVTWQDVAYKAFSLNQTVKIKVMDNAGNISNKTEVVIDKIDKATPIVSINTNGYKENTWVNYNSITLTVSNQSANLGATQIEYKIGAGSWQNYSTPIVISSDLPATTYTFRAKSESGIVSNEKTVVVKRDTVIPTGDITFNNSSVKRFLHTISFGLYCKDTIDVNITSADSLSGVARTQYYKASAILTQTEVEAIADWTEGNHFSMSPMDKDKFVLYVKLTDHAGNVTYFGSDGTIFDTTAPVIHVATNNSICYTTQKITVTDDNMDRIQVNGNDFTNGGLLEGNIDKTYTIVATDKAGNSSTCTVTMKPIVSLSSAIDSITVDNINSSDITTVNTLLKDIDTLLASESLSASEKSALDTLKDRVNTLLNQLTKASNASTVQDIKDTKDITKSNTKLSDKNKLQKAKAALEAALHNYQSNYTDSELTGLQTQLNTIDEALVAIENSLMVVTFINGLPEEAKVKASDGYAIRAAKLAYDALSDAEKTMLSDVLIAKLNADIKALAKGDLPKTDASYTLWLWIAFLFISLGTIIIGVVNIRRKKA